MRRCKASGNPSKIGNKVIFVADACHSGGMTRKVDARIGGKNCDTARPGFMMSTMI